MSLFYFSYGTVRTLTSCFNSYYRPNLRKYYERIGAMEKTKEVLEGQSPAGSMAQYFVAGPLH